MLTQYTVGKNYVQGGLGYSQWNGRSRDIYNDEEVGYYGQNYQGRAKGMVKAADTLTLSGEAKGKANQSSGTFEGWFPSWNLSLELELTPEKWDHTLSIAYSGLHINLNEEQDKHGVEGNYQATYRPFDRLKLSAGPGGSYKRTMGYESSTTSKAKLNGSVAYNFSAMGQTLVLGLRRNLRIQVGRR